MESRPEVTPEELKARLDAGATPALLDVREPWEHEICALPGTRLLPMEELEFRVGELDSARDLVVYCHHGIRSAIVVHWLRQREIPAVSLQGGIDAWALRVDPTLRRY